MENIWNIILTTSYQATIVGILILSIINKSSAIENKVDTKSSNTLNENTVPIKEFENHQNKKEGTLNRVPSFLFIKNHFMSPI